MTSIFCRCLKDLLSDAKPGRRERMKWCLLEWYVLHSTVGFNHKIQDKLN